MSSDSPKSDAPKSALDLVMERLRRQDEARGETPVTLTDAQRAAVAEASRQHEARVAERRIMHQAAVASTFDPMEREARDQELRRDLDRYAREFDEKKAAIRRGSA